MTWLVIVAVGAGSFVFRLAPLLLVQRISLTERADRLIRNGGTAAITALIAMSVKHSATGNAVLPTVLAITVAVGLAAGGASTVRLIVVGVGLYAGSMIVIDLFAR